MNVLALLVCGIVSTAIGFFWYGYLFLKPWRKGHNFSAVQSAALQKSMPTTAAIAFVGYVVTAYVLSLVLSHIPVTKSADCFSEITHLLSALKLTFLLWLGLPAAVTLMNTLYTGGSLVVYAIDTFYVLSYMLASACIITIWP